jgi:hypothetical protein
LVASTIPNDISSILKAYMSDINGFKDKYEQVINLKITIEEYWKEFIPFISKLVNDRIFRHIVEEDFIDILNNYLANLTNKLKSYDQNNAIGNQSEANRFHSEIILLYHQILARLEDKIMERISVISDKKDNEIERITFETIDKIFSLSDQLKLSSSIANDRWTTNDTLGYMIYAIGLAKFISHELTQAPLSISIQAPWGGGKTSMMRILRDLIEKNAPDINKNNYLNDLRISIKYLKNNLKNLPKKKEYPVIDPPKSYSKVETDLPNESIKSHVTIWFNAWKYESSEQIWAGLADSIIQGVAARLEPWERVWFYLRLNSKRKDVNSILNWISQDIWNNVWKNIRPWIWSSVGGILASSIAGFGGWIVQSEFFSYAALVGGAISGGAGLVKTFTEKIEIENEPVESSFGNFLKVPNYKEKLGFIHEVKKDLDMVFESIPSNYRNLIIFIDDLDRCSPSKIAEIMEGINLFLAGEFPGCIFVIGMDTEMVAAALEVSHELVIKKIPKYSSHMPIGWRFMDKFIQLPITMPPSLEKNMKKYVSSLLYEYSIVKTSEKENDKILSNGNDKNNIKQKEAINRKNVAVIKEVVQKMDDISDTNEDFLEQVSKAAIHFSNNPREIKRFMNMLRFYRYIMEVIDNNKDSPSLDQIRRWIILSLKWPQLVRWLYWSNTESKDANQSNDNNSNSTRKKLEMFERFASETTTQEEWIKKLKEIISINDNDDISFSWIGDNNIRRFFATESIEYKERPLSAGAGQGIY